METITVKYVTVKHHVFDLSFDCKVYDQLMTLFGRLSMYLIGTDAKKRYVAFKFVDRQVLAHRFIVGAFAPNTVVDHINGNTLDNREANLRICTRHVNMQNRKLDATNTSGYTGVCWHSKSKVWFGSLTAFGKRYTFKGCDTAYQAAMLREEFLINHPEIKARRNFPYEPQPTTH